jgi:glucuronyl/N-acetylglucosaminyl transferase EXT1
MQFSENYLPNINIYKSLSKDAWNNGLNHIIINFYFGTYPNYANDDLGFDAENAILAWASSSRQVS